MSKSKIAGFMIGVVVAISSVFAFNLTLQPAMAFGKGETRVYSGTLIRNADPKYVYGIEGKTVNIITGNQGYFDTLLGKSVNVKVEFTGIGAKFRIISITPNNSSTSTSSHSNGVAGSASGYLRVAPADSGYNYYLMETNADNGHLLRRINVASWNKPTWDKFIDQKVTLNYVYIQKANGGIFFWNATISAFES